MKKQTLKDVLKKQAIILGIWTLGAIAGVELLKELEPEASGEVAIKSAKHQESFTTLSHAGQSGEAITHHFKLTETRTIESETKDTNENVHASGDKKEETEDNRKSKWCGCFGRARLKKGK